MNTSIRRLYILCVLIGLFSIIHADDNADNGDDFYQADDDAVADEAWAYNDDNDDGDYKNNGDYYIDGNDFIEYWTDYAILTKRCIVYDNVDVMVFQVFDNHYNQCSDTPVGTYYTPVSYYMQGYLQQKEQDMEDQGYEYEYPDAAQYLYCTPYEIQNQMFYFQIGCSDDSTEGLAVNIYTDKDCTTRSVTEEGGYDDSNIDVSEFTPKFKKCRACVNWFDRSDDGEVDDQFYTNRMMNAPLCQTAWQYKQECGRKCQHIGLENTGAGWSKSDKILLSVLTAFGLTMLAMIIKKRQDMSNKDTLLEQAAMSAAGLQQPHVIGIFVLIVLVVTVFALLGLKNITWTLLLSLNAVLFIYLMKLVLSQHVDGADTIIGPDGNIIRRDSDDSDEDDDEDDDEHHEDNRAGTYTLPAIT